MCSKFLQTATANARNRNRALVFSFGEFPAMFDDQFGVPSPWNLWFRVDHDCRRRHRHHHHHYVLHLHYVLHILLLLLILHCFLYLRHHYYRILSLWVYSDWSLFLVDSYPQHVLTTASCFDDDLIHGGVGEVSKCYIYIHTYGTTYWIYQYIYSICIYTYTFTYHILINNICPMQIYIGYQPLTNGMSVQLPEGLANLLLHEEAIRVEPQENAAFI